RAGARGALEPGATRVGLALGRHAIVPHVPVLAADDQVDGVPVADVLEASYRGGVDPRHASLAQHVPRPIAELDPHPPAVDDVELLLPLVVMAAGLVSRRDDDRVDPGSGHPQLAADLAEPV